MKRFRLVAPLIVALVLALTNLAFAGGGAGDDVQRYAGLNVHMASGSIDFTTHAASVMVLDLPEGDQRWEIRDVTLGEDNLTSDLSIYTRVACWFQDADNQHPFASFRIATNPDTGTDPFEPPAQDPSWLGEALSGQVYCGAGAPGSTLTGGMMWFRFQYRSVSP